MSSFGFVPAQVRSHAPSKYWRWFYMPAYGRDWPALPESADNPSFGSPLPFESPMQQSRQRCQVVPDYGSRFRHIFWRSAFDATPAASRESRWLPPGLATCGRVSSPSLPVAGAGHPLNAFGGYQSVLGGRDFLQSGSG